MSLATILHGDAKTRLGELHTESVAAVITRPPAWGGEARTQDPREVGPELDPKLYARHLRELATELWRVLRPNGLLFLTLTDCRAASAGHLAGVPSSRSSSSWRGPLGGDQGAKVRLHGLKLGELVGVPWRVAFELQAAGWWIRSAFAPAQLELSFLLSRDPHLELAGALEAFELEAARHQADPLELARWCIASSSSKGDTVLDPFLGAEATTAVAALELGRDVIGLDLSRSAAYAAEGILRQAAGGELFHRVTVSHGATIFDLGATP